MLAGLLALAAMAWAQGPGPTVTATADPSTILLLEAVRVLGLPGAVGVLAVAVYRAASSWQPTVRVILVEDADGTAVRELKARLERLEGGSG